MKNIEISADWHKLMEDGAGTAKFYFSEAVMFIDNEFGKGYAKEHPELIGAFMNTAAKDNQATIIGKCILSLKDEFNNISSVMQNIADTL